MHPSKSTCAMLTRQQDVCWKQWRPTLSAERSDEWASPTTASLVSLRRMESCPRTIKHISICVLMIPWNKIHSEYNKKLFLRKSEKILYWNWFYRKIHSLSLLESVLLSLVEQICLARSQVNNLRTTVSVFFLYRTFLAVICIRHTGSSANYTSSLEASIVAFVAYSHQGTRAHVGIADDTFSIALFTQTTNR